MIPTGAPELDWLVHGEMADILRPSCPKLLGLGGPTVSHSSESLHAPQTSPLSLLQSSDVCPGARGYSVLRRGRLH